MSRIRRSEEVKLVKEIACSVTISQLISSTSVVCMSVFVTMRMCMRES